MAIATRGGQAQMGRPEELAGEEGLGRGRGEEPGTLCTVSNGRCCASNFLSNWFTYQHMVYNQSFRHLSKLYYPFE